MHATSTQSIADHRTTAKAALVTFTFAAGIALGAAVGATLAPAAAPESLSNVGLDAGAPWFSQYRAGERESGAADLPVPASLDNVGLDSDAPWFKEYRASERDGGAVNRELHNHEASHPGAGGP